MSKKNDSNINFFPVFVTATIPLLAEAANFFVDEIIAGNILDEVAFGSINLIEPYLWVLHFTSYLLLVGPMGMLLRARGERNVESEKKIFANIFTSMFLLGLVLFLMYFIFRKQLAYLVAGDTVAYQYVLECMTPLAIQCIIAPVILLFYTYALYSKGYLFCIFDTIIAAVVNALLSIYLCKRMGIAGIKYATFVSGIAEMMILATFVLIRKNNVSFELKLDLELLRIAIPISFSESFLFMSNLILEFFINKIALVKFSVQGLVAMSVLINIFETVIFISEGISEYETITLNTYLGEKDIDKIKYSMGITFRAAFIEGILFSILIGFLGNELISLFGIEDMQIFSIARKVVAILVMSPIFICYIRVVGIYLQYTNRIKESMFLIIMGYGLMPSLLAYSLSNISIEFMAFGVAIAPITTLLVLKIYNSIFYKQKIIAYDKLEWGMENSLNIQY